jgi:ABC-type uncharacterized transport system substrate-binding protein
MKAEVIYAPDGSVKAVRHAWTFDESFSVFATQGIEAKKKGQFTREELMPLAKVNVESLKEYDYFTDARVNGNKVQFAEPIDYHLEYDPNATVLTLYFTLPFNVPVKAKDVELSIFDPSFFVDLELAENKPVTLVGAARQCKLSVAGPQQMDASTVSRLGQLDATTQLDPSQWFGVQFANRISVKCP